MKSNAAAGGPDCNCMSSPGNNACSHSAEAGLAHSEADNLLGEYSALLQRLGAGPTEPMLDGLTPSIFPSARTIPAVRDFLEHYVANLLFPVELPAIVGACEHARRGETRELISQDQALASEKRLGPFATASRRVGSIQLQRLRPLRDERTAQRYLASVEKEQASGWHTIVYGVTLAVFSIPLRQGLLHYARTTLHGLARAALGEGKYAEAEFQEMLAEIFKRLPAAVEKVLPAVENSLLAAR